jgi:hypothetical protein
MRLLRLLLGSYLELICWQRLKLQTQRLTVPLQQELVLIQQQLRQQQQVMVLVHEGSLSQTGPAVARCC